MDEKRTVYRSPTYAPSQPPARARFAEQHTLHPRPRRPTSTWACSIEPLGVPDEAIVPARRRPAKSARAQRSSGIVISPAVARPRSLRFHQPAQPGQRWARRTGARNISPSDSVTYAPARAAYSLFSTVFGAVWSVVRCSHPLSYRRRFVGPDLRLCCRVPGSWA